MIVRTRIAMTIATVALAGLALFGTAACTSVPAAAAAMSPEQSALTALGFTADDVTTNANGTPAADASASPKGKHPRARRLAIRRLALRGHVEHGQVTVETKNGDKTIDVQRGTVTALTSTTMTVKSTDGFTLTWSISGPLTVIEHRTKIQPGALATGDTVGVAGLQDGATATAKLVVVPNKATTGS